MNKEKVYKVMYLFKKDICHVRTNCRCGCPWGVEVRDKSFNGSHTECMLNNFTEPQLIESVDQNKDFLIKKIPDCEL